MSLNSSGSTPAAVASASRWDSRAKQLALLPREPRTSRKAGPPVVPTSEAIVRNVVEKGSAPIAHEAPSNPKDDSVILIQARADLDDRGTLKGIVKELLRASKRDGPVGQRLGQVRGFQRLRLLILPQSRRPRHRR